MSTALSLGVITLTSEGLRRHLYVFDYRVEAQQNRPFGRGPERKLLLVSLKQE